MCPTKKNADLEKIAGGPRADDDILKNAFSIEILLLQSASICWEWDNQTLFRMVDMVSADIYGHTCV